MLQGGGRENVSWSELKTTMLRMCGRRFNISLMAGNMRKNHSVLALTCFDNSLPHKIHHIKIIDRTDPDQASTDKLCQASTPKW